MPFCFYLENPCSAVPIIKNIPTFSSESCIILPMTVYPQS